MARSAVAMWYGASLAVTLVSGLYDVLAAASGLQILIGAVTSVTAALVSRLLAALAIAAQFRAERERRLAAEAESLRASSKLESTYRAIPIGLFTADEGGALVQTNPAFRALANLSEEAWRPFWSDVFPDHDWKSVLGVASDSPRELEVHRAAPNGEPRWYVVHATRAGDVIEGSLQDVTERKTANDRLRFLADHEPLTGILNRRGIEKEFDEAVAMLGDGVSMSLAYLDLDRFKLIVALLAVLPARADYSNAVMSLNPVGYWRLNEPVSPTLNYALGTATNYGSLGSGANGTYYHSSTLQQPGVLSVDPCVKLDGASQYIDVPYSPVLNTNGPFSVEFWANQTAVAAGAKSGVMSFSGNTGFLFYSDNNDFHW